MRFQEILERCWTGYQQQGMKKKGNRQVPNCVPVEEVKSGTEITGKDLLFKAAAMAMLAASQEGQSLDYEQAIRTASKIYGIPYQPSELPRLLAQRAEIDRQLTLLKQGKQVAKQRRQAKRAPTPAGTDEYWKTHALPTDRIKPATKSLEEATDIFLDNAARDMMAVLSMMAVGFGYGIYVKIRNKLDRYQGYQIVSALEDKGVAMNRATYEKVKPVLDQFKQALKDNDGAQAKELAKRIEQMIVMGKLSASEPQAADTALAAKEKELAEDLKKWFKEKWVRFGPDGRIRGDCARGSSKEGKPKCLPQSKAHALGKKGRASAAAKKRREDPNPERRGAAKNVATKVKEQGVAEGINEGLLYSGDTWQDVLYRINVLNDIFGDQKDLAATFEPASQPEWIPFRDQILRSRTVLDTYAKVKQLANMNVPLTDVEIEMLADVAWDGGGGPVEPAGHWGERDYDWLEDLYAQQFAVVQHLLDQRAQGHGQNKTKSGQTVHEQGMAETVTNVKAGMAEIYRRLAPKIERYRDSFLAGQLYDELENYAELHGAEGEFRRMMSTARNLAHMEYDTNPGGFHNWFWFLPFEDEQDKDSVLETLQKLNADEVRRIQHMLNVKFNANLDVDGELGPLTIKSIKKFLPKVSKSGAPDPTKTTAVQGRESKLDEKQDACYSKVKSRYKVWPSAYASGALVQCRKKGAANWGNKKK